MIFSQVTGWRSSLLAQGIAALSQCNVKSGLDAIQILKSFSDDSYVQHVLNLMLDPSSFL